MGPLGAGRRRGRLLCLLHGLIDGGARVGPGRSRRSGEEEDRVRRDFRSRSREEERSGEKEEEEISGSQGRRRRTGEEEEIRGGGGGNQSEFRPQRET